MTYYTRKRQPLRSRVIRTRPQTQRSLLNLLEESMHSNVQDAYTAAARLAEANCHKEVSAAHLLLAFLLRGESDPTLPVQRTLRELGAQSEVLVSLIGVQSELEGTPRTDGGMPTANKGLLDLLVRSLEISEEAHTNPGRGVTIQTSHVILAMTEFTERDSLLKRCFLDMGILPDEVRLSLEP